ncbi:MAG: neutral/alkaline non-lysosomal ceramidase N-terminal domain-containing protein [Sandaracinaceae bacterium]
MRFACLLTVLVFSACDGAPAPSDASLPEDAGQDAGPRMRTREVLPDPGPLRAGVAEARLPAPLGIGTMGYGAIDVEPSVTPFAERFPGTTRMHGELTFRAVAISRGDAHEVVFVRMDTVGVFQQLREAVLDTLEARLGRRLDDALILAGNHTHSGPGRMLMTSGALVALGDTFFPEFYDGVVEALADVIEAALDDLQPAELATAVVGTSDAHRDRRCANDMLPLLQESPDLPFIAVRREGRVDAIVASYAYHGTVLGLDDHTLSGDMGSVVEHRVEDRLDFPTRVLFFNSFGADMSPSSPAAAPDEVGADQPGGYDRMDRLGDVIADAILPSLADLEFGAEPDVRVRTYRVPISTADIGYGAGEFDYRHGGAFCGVGSEGNCTDLTPIEGLDGRCVPISRAERLPKQTMISVGAVGGLALVTGAGEWSTSLAAGVLERARELSGLDAMFIGYANDYVGYSLTEEDWFMGGYEASGALWGPRQGDYLAARTREALETFDETWNEPPWIEPARAAPFTDYTYEPYVPEAAQEPGRLLADVPASVPQTELVTFTVAGGDPWLGAPVATLERADGTPVTRANARPFDSRSYDIWADLRPEPSYAEVERADSRTFAWTFNMPARRRAGSSVSLAGDYRFRVSIPTAAGESMEVTTGTFTVE